MSRAWNHRRLAALVCAGAGAAAAGAAPPPFLAPAEVRALAAEISGAAAKRTVQELVLHHRMRGSRGFGAAAEWIAARLREGGLAEVELIELPADGEIFYGTQRSRPAWDAEFAELWEQTPVAGGGWADARRIASWEARPITLAQDSASGAVAAELVDVGAGTAESDYARRDVRGKLVLAGAQPGAVRALAVARHGAAGIVSYAPNQRTAWWREDETLVRWGHLESFPPPSTFAFMVSLRQARDWQQRLARGEAVRLRAEVRAGQHAGAYTIVGAAIPGADPVLREQEIVFSCHLDHPSPGANDNASGCAAILEVARALQKLVREGKLAPPRRTLRFVWPAEVEGTIALLDARPELAARARAVVHMDMVGGERAATKAVLHVTRSPKSLPSFVNDVAEAWALWVNAESDEYAATGQAWAPLADPEGGREALQAEAVEFSAGSDHQVWSEGSFRVPAVYLNDWPDRYIHTDGDRAANIDPTKLLRAAFLGAASGYTLANLDADGVPAVLELVRAQALARTAGVLARRRELAAAGFGAAEAANLMRFHFAYELAVVDSLEASAPLPSGARQEARSFLSGLWRLVEAPGSPSPPASGPASAAAEVVYTRAPSPKGPMDGFGYSYFDDRLERLAEPRPGLLAYQGLWGDGSLFAYEALNLVDGRRSVARIHADLAAIYGPLPAELVADYLAALARIGVLRKKE